MTRFHVRARIGFARQFVPPRCALALLALLFAAACGANVDPPPNPVVTKPPPPPPDPQAPLVVPGDSVKPAWLLPQFDDRRPDPFEPTTTGGRGDTFASVWSGAMGFYLISNEHGVRDLPVQRAQGQRFWFDGAGHIYFMASSKLMRASVDKAFQAGAFEEVKLPAVPIKVHITKDLFIFTSGPKVYYSRDGGKTFTDSQPFKKGGTIFFLGGRPDGVAVASVLTANEPPWPKTTFVTKDGKRWAKATFQPNSLEQSGNWIHNLSDSCPATLGADGKSWLGVHPSTVPAFAQSGLASLAVQPTPRIRGRSSWLLDSLTEPAAPSKGKGIKVRRGKEDKCKGDSESYAIGYGFGPTSTGPRPSCEGAACLRRAQGGPYPTKLEFALLSDAWCKPENADEEGYCKPAGPWVRLPHAVVISHDPRKAIIADLPSGCVPTFLFDAAGIGVLACEAQDGQSAVYSLDASGRFHAEGTVVLAHDEAWQAPLIGEDGTLVVRNSCDESQCHALVRSPGEPGGGTWQVVSHEGAVGYAPGPGGSVVIVAAEGAGPATFEMVTATATVTLASGVAVPGDVTTVAVESGNVVVSNQDGRWVLTNGGQLQ